jgi:regulator-associated protein of mTOR
LLASFADGVIKVFDRRLEEEDAVVRSFNEHTNWVQNVRWQPQFGNQFVSARSVFSFAAAVGWLRYYFSLNGEVKLCDIRGSDRAAETWDFFPGGLAAFDVHAQCGVFAG